MLSAILLLLGSYFALVLLPQYFDAIIIYEQSRLQKKKHSLRTNYPKGRRL